MNSDENAKVASPSVKGVPGESNSLLQEESSLPAKPTSKRSTRSNAWSILLIHTGVCLAIALAVALAVNGYEALDDQSASHAAYIDGRLVLRVGDVTTLISAALVVVKLLVSWWTTLAVWACGQHLASKSPQPESPDDEAIQAKATNLMLLRKLLPWQKPSFSIPRNTTQ